jgi:hypothetical protein
MRYRFYLIAAALTALTAIPPMLAVAAPARSITLKPSDLPSGYHQTTSATVSNAQMAQKTGVPKAQFDQHGRITGYETDYTTIAPVGSRSYAAVGSKAYSYKTSGGAHWDFTHAVAADRAQGAKPVAAARVGDESTVLSGVQKAGKTSYTINVVIFRRGVTDMTLVVIAATGQTTVNTALHYARMMDARASH